MQGTESTKLPEDWFPTTKLFIETLVEEMKPIIMGNKGG